MTEFNPYAEGYQNDPVTKDAVAAALAATDPIVRKRPVTERFWVWTFILLIFIGLFGAVLSVIDSIQVSNYASQIRKQRVCIEQLTQRSTDPTVELSFFCRGDQ